jgi:hypothetical protein
MKKLLNIYKEMLDFNSFLCQNLDFDAQNH